MSIEWKFEKDKLVVYRVSGEPGIDEYQRAQADIEASIRMVGRV